jgi:hypothetical protein
MVWFNVESSRRTSEASDECGMGLARGELYCSDMTQSTTDKNG